MNKAIWKSPAGAMDVAVKTLKPGSSEDEKVKFLQEAAINGQFKHPNVVQLLGVVTVGEPVSVFITTIERPRYLCLGFVLYHHVGYDCIGAAGQWRPAELPCQTDISVCTTYTNLYNGMCS